MPWLIVPEMNSSCGLDLNLTATLFIVSKIVLLQLLHQPDAVWHFSNVTLKYQSRAFVDESPSAAPIALWDYYERQSVKSNQSM